MTQMVETERQLAIETKKAQETELLKQAFLTNMSYEIRPPQNSCLLLQGGKNHNYRGESYLNQRITQRSPKDHPRMSINF